MIPRGLTPRVSPLGEPVPLRGCLTHARALPIDVPLMRPRVPLTGRVVQEDSLWESIGSETPYGRWRPSSSARQFEATQHGRISASVRLCPPGGGIVSGYLPSPGARPGREGRRTSNRRGRVTRVLPSNMHTLLGPLKELRGHRFEVQALTLRNLRTPIEIHRRRLRLRLHRRAHVTRVYPLDTNGSVILPTRVSHSRPTLNLRIQYFPLMHSNQRLHSATDLLRKIGDASAPTGSLTNSISISRDTALQPRRERRLRFRGKQRNRNRLLSRLEVLIVHHTFFPPFTKPSPVGALRAPTSPTPGTESRLR